MTRVQPSAKCKLCHKVLIKELWTRERREYHVHYFATLCPQCSDVQVPSLAPQNAEPDGRARQQGIPRRWPGGPG